MKIEIQNISEVVKPPIIFQNELWDYFDEGLTRVVYVNKDKTKVAKFNKETGCDFNKMEIEIFNEVKEFRRSEMVKTEIVNGVIVQDFALPIKMSDKRMTIQQMLFASACRNEVGWIGEDLFCFDLSEYRKY